MNEEVIKQYQYWPPETIPFTDEVFDNHHETAVYWLSNAGVMINSHGLILLIDPNLAVIDGKYSEARPDMAVVTPPPIYADHLKRVDAVLYTHADPDHMGPVTLQILAEKTEAKFYGTPFTCDEITCAGIPKERCSVHKAGDEFQIGDVIINLTPADHAWQLECKGLAPQQFHVDDDWYYSMEDCCGFKFKTRDGIIWCPGDTMLLSTHLTMKDVDVAFFDISDDDWHFGIRNAVRLFRALDKSDMILYHYGTIYGPDVPWCNGDPIALESQLSDYSRLKILAAGEKYVVKSNHKQEE